MPLDNPNYEEPHNEGYPIERLFDKIPDEAGKWLRCINGMTDIILSVFFMFFMGSFFTEFLNIHSDNIFAVIAMIFHALYYFVPEYLFGKTIGKMITRTRVVTETGTQPTFNQLILRTLCRYIPFEYFSFLGEGTGWHDTLSNTRVVKGSRTTG